MPGKRCCSSWPRPSREPTARPAGARRWSCSTRSAPALPTASTLCRGRYLKQLGRYEESARERLRAEQTTPAGALDWFLTALDHWRAGDVHTALVHIDRALAEAPELFWKFFGSFAAAQRCQQLREPAQRGGDAEPVRCAPAELRLVAPALRYLNIDAGSLRDAEVDLALHELCPLDSAARYALFTNRGALALKRQRPDLAVAAFQHPQCCCCPTATTLTPTWPRPTGKRTASRGSGLASLDHAIRLGADRPELYRLRAGFLHTLGPASPWPCAISSVPAP